MKMTRKQQREAEAAALAKRVAESDAAIAEALACLTAHERGREVLVRFKELTEPASGLDSEGMQALAILTMEFGGGRRDFLEKIVCPAPSLATTGSKFRIQTISRSGKQFCNDGASYVVVGRRLFGRTFDYLCICLSGDRLCVFDSLDLLAD